VSTRETKRLLVEDLHVRFGDGRRPVVRGISFAVEPNQAFGLVGESGSGKSITLRSILGLLPPGARASGSIRFGEDSLLELPDREMQRLRGSWIGMVFQDPMTALNPVLRVGTAIAQVIESHRSTSRREARQEALRIMERVGIREAASRYDAYPHQFSGGMRQRIVMAMAFAAQPTLLLADEPTTALDVVVQAAILKLLDGLRREGHLSLLLVSHDLAIISGVCDTVAVMYAGEIVEQGRTADVLRAPRHPYTLGLISSLPEMSTSPRLPSIPGSPPEPGSIGQGCAFAPRCAMAVAACTEGPIPLRVLGDRRSRCIRAEEVPPLPTEPGRDAEDAQDTLAVTHAAAARDEGDG
jgi:oligopeptide/dipeptide ABC transporter ATP-binding protein